MGKIVISKTKTIEYELILNENIKVRSLLLINFNNLNSNVCV